MLELLTELQYYAQEARDSMISSTGNDAARVETNSRVASASVCAPAAKGPYKQDFTRMYWGVLVSAIGADCCCSAQWHQLSRVVHEAKQRGTQVQRQVSLVQSDYYKVIIHLDCSFPFGKLPRMQLVIGAESPQTDACQFKVHLVHKSQLSPGPRAHVQCFRPDV